MTSLPAPGGYNGTGLPAAPEGAPARRPGPARRLAVLPGRYGDTRLVVVAEVAPVIDGSGQARRAVLCECDCGTPVTIKLNNLPRTHSCGCWRRDVTATLNQRCRGQAATP